MSFFSARKEAGMSQADVAEAVGVSSAAVCQWETGKTMPDPRKLPKIAELFNCTIDELLTPDTAKEQLKKER